MRDDYIAASEISEFLYCNRAWWFRRQGAQSANLAQMAEGTQQHDQLADQVKAVEKGANLGWVLVLIGVAIFIGLVLARDVTIGSGMMPKELIF